jgi:hypothetical protein
MLVNNRYGDHNPTQYIVYDLDRRRPLYFCKVGRLKFDEALKRESARLAEAEALLAGTPLQGSIPHLRFAGYVEGVALQVVEYVEMRSIPGEFLDGMRRYEKFTKLDSRILTAALSGIKVQARRAWLGRIHPYMLKAIDWLAAFQSVTRCGSFDVGRETTSWCEERLLRIQERGWDMSAARSRLKELKADLAELRGVMIPICMQHGDLDLTNVFHGRGGIFVVDFEHAERTGVPFFDAATLVFNSLILEWRASRRERSLRQYAAATRWAAYLKKWLHRYADDLGLPLNMLRLIPTIGVIEQNARRYPPGRDPTDLPLYGEDTLSEMIAWQL